MKTVAVAGALSLAAPCSTDNDILHPWPYEVMFALQLLFLLSSYCCTVITALGRESRHINNR